MEYLSGCICSISREKINEPVLIEKYCEALAAVSQTSRPFVVFTGRNVFPDSEFIQSLTKQVAGVYLLAEHEISRQHQTLLHSVTQLLCFRRIGEQAARLGDIWGSSAEVARRAEAQRGNLGRSVES
jgi:hypothetical protein